jgi:hypothetical protein
MLLSPQELHRTDSLPGRPAQPAPEVLIRLGFIEVPLHDLFFYHGRITQPPEYFFP